MAIEFKRTAMSGHTPEIWRGECKMLPAGYKPVQAFASGTVIHRGTLLYVDEENLTAAVVKLATVLKGSTTKTVRVAKGNLFAVGDVITKYGDGASTPTISAIDTTNDDYDAMTLSAGITGLAENDIIVESAAVSDGNATAKYTPNAIVGAVIEFNGKGIPTIDAAYEANVLRKSLPYTVPSDWLVGGLCLAGNPTIKFINQ